MLDGENVFQDIVIFDGMSRDVKYIDPSLNQTTLAKTKLTSTFYYNGFPLASSKEWTLSLSFNNAQCNDSGQYRWVIKYFYYSSFTSSINRTSNIIVGVHGTFSRTPDNGISILPGPNIKEGTALQVRCKADIGNNPRGSLQMYYHFPNGTLDPVHGNLTKGENPISDCSFAQETTYVLNVATRRHSGLRFRCILQQENSTEFRESRPINVLYPPGNMHISKYQNRSIYTEGANVTFNCTADGNPQPSYAWQFPNGSILSTGPLLLLFAMRCSDSGEYKCIARNGEPNIRRVVQVSVFISVETYQTNPWSKSFPFSTHNPSIPTIPNSCIDKPGYACGNNLCSDNYLASVYCKRTCHRCEPPAIIGR